VLAPGLLALLGLVILAGRLAAASSAVEQAAAAGARAASLARDARSAEQVARTTVRDSLTGGSVPCAEASSQVDVAGFATAVGRPAQVSVRVECRVPLADLVVPGMPGERTVSAEGVSPLDRFRGRG